MYLSLDVKTVNMIEGFTRDVTDIGYHGTSNLEMIISDTKYINEVKELLQRAYNEN